MPMMGRGSDTRMYSPRSESDKMYSSANEDEDKYSPADPEYNEQKREEKKRKAEEKKAKRGKVKHIKIRATQGLSGEESPSPLDDGNKRDDEREIGLAGGPAGSRGTLLDLATGAKSGTGSAMSPGLPIAMSEPMEDAWSSLLKQEPADYANTYQRVRNNIGADGGHMSDEELNSIRSRYSELHDDKDHLEEYYNLLEAIELEQMRRQNQSFDGIGHNESTNFTMSEPMKDAWSSLLKQDPNHEHDVGDGTNEDTQRYFDDEVRPKVMNPNTPRPYATMDNGVLETKMERMMMRLEPFDEELSDEYNYRMVENDIDARGSPVTDAGFDRTFQDVFRSEPMDIAFQLLKMPFHGTTEDAIEGGRFFGGIKRRGLQPKSPGDGLPKNVFFTDNPVDAANYAKRGAKKHNSRPVMIEFPESDVPTQSSQLPWYAGNYRTTNQTISPTNFQYHYGPQREEGVTDEQYDQQMNQWMFQMNRLQQPQVQQPQVQQPQVQQPQMIQQGEPMDIAFQLLKEEPLYLQPSNTLARRAREELETDKMGQNSPAYQEMMERLMEMYEPQDGTISLEDNLDQYAEETGKNPWRMLAGQEMPNKYGGTAKVQLDPLTPIHPQQFYDWQAKNASEPMKDAWSSLLKRETPRTIAGRRRREARQQFRPSTGQFKTPPGGMSGGAGATMRRFKAQMRGIKSGKKTGLMKPHLSVEMSHRGIQTKQPLSKDPQKYTQYKGQSEARKIMGNVRTPFSPHARYGARSNYAGPTGAGRIGGLMPGQRGQMSRPALRRMRVPRPRMPRMSAPRPPTPPMMPQMQSSVPAMPAPPSSIMMSEERYNSEILKARNTLHRVELLNLMRRLIQAKEREAKIKKNLTATDAADLPGHPVGVKPTDDEDLEGPTENLETDAKTFGLDPVGIINSRRGHM